jgi:hypothetical protein
MPDSNSKMVQYGILTAFDDNGKYLAWSDQYHIASYGESKQEAIDATIKCIEEDPPPPDGFAIPQGDDDDLIGSKLQSIVFSWIGDWLN